MSNRNKIKKIQVLGGFNQALTPENFASKVDEFFAQLKTIENSFSQLVYAVWINESEYDFKGFKPRKTVILDYLLNHFDSDPSNNSTYSYKDLSKENKITVSSLRNNGWSLPIMYTKDLLNERAEEPSKNSFSIMLGGGGYEHDKLGSIDIQLPDDKIEFYKVDKIFKLALNFFDFIEKGSVYSFDFFESYKQSEWLDNGKGSMELKSKYSDSFNIGWINYFNPISYNKAFTSQIDSEILSSNIGLIYVSRTNLEVDSINIQKAQRIHNELEQLDKAQ